jgi:hypothetical protein
LAAISRYLYLDDEVETFIAQEVGELLAVRQQSPPD